MTDPSIDNIVSFSNIDQRSRIMINNTGMNEWKQKSVLDRCLDPFDDYYHEQCVPYTHTHLHLKM